MEYQGLAICTVFWLSYLVAAVVFFISFYREEKKINDLNRRTQKTLDEIQKRLDKGKKDYEKRDVKMDYDLINSFVASRYSNFHKSEKEDIKKQKGNGKAK